MLENWKKITVKERNWKQDTSGIYTVINWAGNSIRLDVMSDSHMPIVSFEGETSGAIYKGFSDWLELQEMTLSLEHSMYIGRELGRVEIEKENYVQD